MLFATGRPFRNQRLQCTKRPEASPDVCTASRASVAAQGSVVDALNNIGASSMGRGHKGQRKRAYPRKADSAEKSPPRTQQGMSRTNGSKQGDAVA